MLKSELRRLENSVSRADMKPEYVKNIVLSFLAADGDAQARDALVPVLAEVLALDGAEVAALRQGTGLHPHPRRTSGDGAGRVQASLQQFVASFWRK